MNSNLILKLITVCLVGLLGACTNMVKLPDGTFLGVHGASNLNHASSYSSRWRDTGQKDAEGNPVLEEVMVQKILGTRPDGTPIIAMVKAGETIQGPSVAGQMAVAAVGGTGAAIINGNTARAVARIGQCPAGSVCPGATVITNQVQSIAEAITDTRVKVGVNAGKVAACAATKSCSD